jgi:transcription initiation factor TFIID subunit 5
MKMFRDEFSQLHGDELDKLSGIYDASQLKDNSVASMFRSNKFTIHMSSYSFQLLITYLQEQKFVRFIKIINQFIKIRSTYDIVNVMPSLRK